jgi:hypothetical protein
VFFVAAVAASVAARADSGSLDTGGADTGPGRPPVADAGQGLMAYVGDTVILDGSGSYDPDGDPLTFEWTQTGGPAVGLERADTAEPKVSIDAAGTLRFTLVVFDGASASPADEVAIVVPRRQVDAAKACATSPIGPGWLLAAALAAAMARRQR